MTGYSLAYQLDRRRPLAENLAGALAKHLEHFKAAATVLTVHPGEIVEAPGLTVIESRSVRPGQWTLGVGS